MKESEKERVGDGATGFRDVLAGSGKRARLKCVAKRLKLGEEGIKRGIRVYNFHGRGTMRGPEVIEERKENMGFLFLFPPRCFSFLQFFFPSGTKLYEWKQPKFCVSLVLLDDGKWKDKGKRGLSGHRVNFTFTREFYFDPAVFPTTALRREPCLHKEVPRFNLSIPPISPHFAVAAYPPAHHLATRPLVQLVFRVPPTPLSSKS